MEGILEKVTPQLEERLGEYRLAHSQSVATTARSLAKVYDVDREAAYLAGMLHDWDKDVDEETLLSHAREYGIEVPAEDAYALLHAQTGAADLHRLFPEIDDDIIQAISRHTMAAVDMTPLDKVVYCADLLEPLRSKAAIEDIRFNIGAVDLDELFLECYTCSLRFLIDKRRYIHPGALEIWNAII